MKFEQVNGDNIISLMPRRAEMNYPAISQVEAYWEALRNGRPVPPRAEIDPRGMNDALEFAFILERIAPGVARFRLAGMHLSDLMGMEVRGMPLTAMFVADARTQISTVLESVFSLPQTAHISLRGERGVARGPLEAQLLLCPLKSDLGDVNRILGCLQSRGDIGRQPRRFEVLAVEERPILHPDIAPAPKAPDPSPAERPQGLSEAQAPFNPSHGHLRLVVSDEH